MIDAILRRFLYWVCRRNERYHLFIGDVFYGIDYDGRYVPLHWDDRGHFKIGKPGTPR